MCYLRGPLTRPQIRALTEQRAAGARGPAAPGAPAATPATPAPPARVAPPSPPSPPAPPADAAASERPLLPPELQECFLPPAGAAGPVQYVPRLLASARVHYVDARRGVDAWQDVTLLAPIEADGALSPWEQAEERAVDPGQCAPEPLPGARFAELPPAAARGRSWAGWKRSLADHLYRNRPLKLVAAPALKLVSRPGESEGDFRARTSLALRERRDAEMARMQQRYAPKLKALQERLARAEERQRREQSQLGQRRVETGIAFGATLLGALFGRKAASASTVGRASTAMRSMSRAAHEQGDVAAAQESVATLQQQLANLQAEGAAAVGQLGASLQEPALEPVAIAPRKADTVIESLVLAWVPAQQR
jgi:hypothetical protein